jgi:hypothetical protein
MLRFPNVEQSLSYLTFDGRNTIDRAGNAFYRNEAVMCIEGARHHGVPIVNGFCEPHWLGTIEISDRALKGGHLIVVTYKDRDTYGFYVAAGEQRFNGLCHILRKMLNLKRDSSKMQKLWVRFINQDGSLIPCPYDPQASIATARLELQRSGTMGHYSCTSV